MNPITIFFLSISLAADAFAVSVGTGISEKKIHLKNALKMSLCFGLFQALMPVIGFFFAGIFFDLIRNYDHWIAFLLLGYIGGSMTYAGLSSRPGEEKKADKNTFGWKSLLLLSIATSIDALAVGVSLIASTQDIWTPALAIGIITFFLSFLGIEFGKKWGEKIGNRAEIIGGLILIGIGIKILGEHIVQ